MTAGNSGEVVYSHPVHLCFIILLYSLAIPFLFHVGIKRHAWDVKGRGNCWSV